MSGDRSRTSRLGSPEHAIGSRSESFKRVRNDRPHHDRPRSASNGETARCAAGSRDDGTARVCTRSEVRGHVATCLLRLDSTRLDSARPLSGWLRMNRLLAACAVEWNELVAHRATPFQPYVRRDSLRVTRCHSESKLSRCFRLINIRLRVLIMDARFWIAVLSSGFE